MLSPNLDLAKFQVLEFQVPLDDPLDFIEFGGIVARNTTGILMRAGASSPTLSSSAASTTADIQLAEADRMTYWLQP